MRKILLFVFSLLLALPNAVLGADDCDNKCRACIGNGGTYDNIKKSCTCPANMSSLSVTAGTTICICSDKTSVYKDGKCVKNETKKAENITISGKVTSEKHKKKGLADVQILLASDKRRPNAKWKTNADGTFSLTNLKPNYLSLIFSLDGYQDKTIAVPQETKTNLEIVLQEQKVQKTRQITGEIYDDSDAKIQSKISISYKANGKDKQTTVSKGKFDLTADTGTKIIFSGQGYENETCNVDIGCPKIKMKTKSETNNTNTPQETQSNQPEPDEEKLKKAKEAEKNYQDAKENRDSTENRMLNFATTLAASQGASTMLSAMAEKKADAAAEQEMTAYLGEMYCEYGGGHSVRVGLTDVEIPGGNELLNYYSEYKNIADRLKTQKTALNLPAGLESQTVYDKAESNLYKNVSLGRGAGAQTSLSRALLDSNSADAAAWQAQKDKTAKNLKTGALVAGGAVVAGFAANKLLNREYNERKKKLKEDFKEKEKKFIEQNEEIVVPRSEEVEQEEVKQEETGETPAEKTADERPLSNVLSKIGFKVDGENKVLFKTNAATLTQAGEETLKDFATNWVAQVLDKYKDAKIKIAITGHTDKTGDEQYNIDLSKRRAENVKNFLDAQLNSYKSRIWYEWQGKGYSECNATGADDNCRRIDIKITDETSTEMTGETEQ